METNHLRFIVIGLIGVLLISGCKRERGSLRRPPAPEAAAESG